MLRLDIIQKIKAELQADPAARGYSGKTDVQIADLLNNPVVEEKTISITYKTAVTPSRINQIFTGVTGAPNAVTAQDVVDVRNSV